MHAFTGPSFVVLPLLLGAHFVLVHGLARIWSRRDSRVGSNAGRPETRTERTYRLLLFASAVSLLLALVELFACDVINVRMNAPEGVLVRFVAGFSVLALLTTTAGYHGYRDGWRDGSNSRG